MTPLHTLLTAAEGSDLIRKCWQEVPCFDGPFAIIHLRQSEQDILLTCLLLTNKSDDGNKCKPSQVLVQFSGVTHWEYDYDSAEANGIRLSSIFSSPPAGFIAVDVHRSFYIVCRKVAVLSCEHRPFTNLEDEKVAT